MVKMLRHPNSDRYGEFFVMPVTDIFGNTGENANKYALMAEDWYVCNCNGDKEYVPIIVGDSPEEVRLWAVAGGFAVHESPPPGFTHAGVIITQYGIINKFQ